MVSAVRVALAAVLLVAVPSFAAAHHDEGFGIVPFIVSGHPPPTANVAFECHSVSPFQNGCSRQLPSGAYSFWVSSCEDDVTTCRPFNGALDVRMKDNNANFVVYECSFSYGVYLGCFLVAGSPTFTGGLYAVSVRAKDYDILTPVGPVSPPPAPFGQWNFWIAS